MKPRTIILNATIIVACLSMPFLDSACDKHPITPVDVEAGEQIGSGVCSLLEGIDDSGVLRTICATLPEIAAVASFILTLRTITDGGTSAQLNCTVLSGTSVCASKQEIAKGILHISKMRQMRLSRDASF